MMEWFYRFRWSLLGLAVIALILLWVNLGSREEAQDQVPEEETGATLALEDCGHELPEGVAAKCGRYHPAMDAGDAGGVEPSLPVMVLARDGEWEGAATLFLPGGPGAPGGTTPGDAHLWGNWMLATGWPGRLVVFDPRGTGQAEPALRCPGYGLYWRGIVGQLMDPLSEARERARMLADCHRELVAAGIEPTAFSTRTTVADVLGLVEALDLETPRLLGVSHGSRVGLQLLRHQPWTFSAAVFDGVFPPEHDPVMSLPDLYQDAIDRLFSHCQLEDDCRTALPEGRATLDLLAGRLDAAPETLFVLPADEPPVLMKIDGKRFLDLIFAAQVRESSLSRIPRALLDASLGDYRVFAEAVRPAAESALGRGQSDPVYWASICEEMAPHPDLDGFDRRAAELGLEHLFPAASVRKHPCLGAWPASDAGALSRTPVGATLPAFFLAGEMDPITPARWAGEQLERFPAGKLLRVERGSHGQLFGRPCAEDAVVVFLEDPEAFGLPEDCAAPEPLFDLSPETG